MRAKKVVSAIVSVALVGVLGCAGLAGCTSSGTAASNTNAPAAQPATHTVTDMAGRSVELPTKVTSVATFGSVGVLNAFVECLGAGSLIVNQMPANFTKNDKWAMQYKFAPQIANGPVLETADGVDMEAVMKLNPDVCITMTKETAEQLEQNGVKCIVLNWNNTDDVKTAVTLMGEVLGKQDIAADYNKYFDTMVEKAANITKDIPEADRASVIYGDVETLTNPHIISEWWISAAGGNSVTADAHRKNSLKYTLEDLLAWQPQVIFSSNTKTSDIYADEKIAQLPAIQNKKVYVVPTVAHVWGNRTVEQPLTVMWAMNKMYPDKYTKAELSSDISYFYERFFNYKMSDDEIKKIIG
ncbi:ABC transporter substrate-binding protein [Berryella wangjianweii]|uniref:ABC transporter substrate-binding protein n=1 Tax=Berryella wangjianweii TaxID=2734634 RepID=A0A6M8J0G6_9ACTN|nr:ABC transporter substrate-binding protein [Berryella wangjianweii]QKF07067.1 ABC transporter substrate-binding protein [Berryella wangjianweii]